MAPAYLAHSERDQVLTPRTPRSRAGRAEEARYEVDSDDTQYANYYELEERQQRAPLLASSNSATFPGRSRARPAPLALKKGKTPWAGNGKLDWSLLRQRVPLLAGLVSTVLLMFLVLMSVEQPEKLHTYLHGAPTPGTMHGNANHSMAMLSYENYTSFPLEPLEYRQECATFLAGMKGPMGTYWYIPPGGPMDVAHADEGQEDSKICKSTITYMLDGYVGLAADLALIAQAAGLARETNRTFFVDDRNWNRGRWTDHFQDVRVLQPGPEPGCLPPPPEELVACPRTARHWVINSRTALFHFGHHFMDEFENPYARELRRSKPIFQRAVSSFAHTIRPSAPLAELIRTARREINGPYLALHARRGDRRTEAWEFHGGYVPIENYVEAVGETWQRVKRMDLEDSTEARVWIASDDPGARRELVDRLSDPYGQTNVTHEHLYSLERSEYAELRELASLDAYVQAEFGALSEEERSRLTRGAIVDFALVTGLWSWEGDADADADGGEGAVTRLEGIICTISSNFCKLAAVGLGWDRAFGFEPGDPDRTIMTMDEDRKRWVEIDLRGSVDPVWRAFELF